MSFFDIDASTTSGPLTLDSLLKTFEQLERPRPPHHHVISSRAQPGTLTLCGDCGAPVRVPDTWGKR